MPPLEIRLDNSTLFIDQQRLAFGNKQRLLQTLQLFLNAPNRTVSRDELMRALGSPALDEMSPRLYDCELHNIIKSISRLRVFMQMNLPVRYSHIEWFPYFEKYEVWKLYQVHDLDVLYWDHAQRRRRGI